MKCYRDYAQEIGRMPHLKFASFVPLFHPSRNDEMNVANTFMARFIIRFPM